MIISGQKESKVRNLTLSGVVYEKELIKLRRKLNLCIYNIIFI